MTDNHVIKDGYLCGYRIVSKSPSLEELKEAHAMGMPTEFIETSDCIVPFVFNLVPGDGKTRPALHSANPSSYKGPLNEGFKVVFFENKETTELMIIDFRVFIKEIFGLDHEEVFPGFNWEEMFDILNPNH